MASRSLPYILLLLYLNRGIIVDGTTTVYFYSDALCTTLYATVETDSQAGNGLCGLLTANSAMSGSWDNGCSGTHRTSLELLTINSVLTMLSASHGLRGDRG